MVELDHSFSTGKPTDYNWEAILDLDRLIPCVQGGKVVERTSPTAAKAEIKVKMGAMSMTFAGTVEVVEQDDAAHRALLKVKSREVGGQGHANGNGNGKNANGKTKRQLSEVTVRFAGDSGDGMQLAGTQFTDTSALVGNDISTLPDLSLIHI